MSLTAVRYPVAPATTPLKGTLLDLVTVDTEFAWHDGRALYDTYNCLQFQEAGEFCAPNEKDLDQVAGWTNGFRFAAYGGVTCKSVGLDFDRMRSEVERVFKSGESTAVERALMANVFAEYTYDGDADPAWDAADIVDATAYEPKVALALLEGHAADNYVGVPTIHMPRTIASLLIDGGVLHWEGSTLVTGLGSKVVAGAGYDYPNLDPAGDEADAGEKWLYATGEVFVSAGPLVNIQEMERTTNEVFVLAERPYIVAVDCYKAAIAATVTA